MQQNIKHGLLVDCNSEITEEQMSALISGEPITDHYVLDKDYFARGKFANVRRVQHKQTGQWFAAKSLKKRRLRYGNVTDEILHEIRVLLTAAKCSRIVQLHQVFETATEFILVLELAQGGELQQVLDEDDCIKEDFCCRILRQIVEGVQFLHSHHIAHLDVKPQNILLTKPLPEGDVKLCDFGISRVISTNYELREIMGTTDYMSPEILHYEPISLASDMWSIGIVAYVLLSGHSPFAGDDKFATYSNITSGELEFPEHLFSEVSECAQDFISRLLIIDPKKRMTCDECLEHEWLSNKSLTNQCTLQIDGQLPRIVSANLNSDAVAVAPSTPDCKVQQLSDESCPTPTLPDIIITTTASTTTNFSNDHDDNHSSASVSSLSSDGSSLDTVTASTEVTNSDLNNSSVCDNTLSGHSIDTKETEDTFVEDKMELEENDKENSKPDNSNETVPSPPTSTLPLGKHKRLSSDIYSDRKSIAIISELSLSTTLKRYTSESSMTTVCSNGSGGTVTPDTNNNQILQSSHLNNQSLSSLSTYSRQDRLGTTKESTFSSSTTNISEDNSPPSTPRKKFFMSIETVVKSSLNVTNITRSVSMERLDRHS